MDGIIVTMKINDKIYSVHGLVFFLKDEKCWIKYEYWFSLNVSSFTPYIHVAYSSFTVDYHTYSNF